MRKRKTASNEEWVSPTDLEAKIARMKGGINHPAYKAEHVVDLTTDIIVAAETRPATDHQRAVMNNRERIQSDKGKALQWARSELCERSFAHVCQSGGMR